MLVKLNRTWITVFVSSFVVTLLLGLPLRAAYLRDVPQTVMQPNGQVLHCFASGDEYFHWLHDANGYPITQDPNTGYFVYAVQINEELSPTYYVPGMVSPQSIGLQKGVRVSREMIEERRTRIFGSQAERMARAIPAPTTGSINNIVIFIRFSDEPEFTDQISTYESMFNAGTNSMYNYYREVSYNALSIGTTFYPIPAGSTVLSYQDSYPRNYYRRYNAVTNPIGYPDPNVNPTEMITREMTLLKNAVDAVGAQVPAGLNIDADGDGKVDNVCFVVYGSPDGWNDLLWPHMWELYYQTAYINGKRVWTFNFQLQTALASDGAGVLSHEMFHSLGAPDLYHYSYDGLDPVSKWDIMDWNQNPPQHMGAYMKYRYGGWINSIPEITASGVYTLNPLTSSTNNCYKIRSPNSNTQYFVLEYRRKTGTFENSLPGSGLLVYRINTARDGQGNVQGPPDEVYIYRPNGTTTTNGYPNNANFSSNTGRTAINDSTNPSCFLTNGSAGGLSISNIGSVGTTISFQVNLPSTVKWKGMAMVSCPVIPGGTDPKPIIGFSNNSWYAYRPSQNRYAAYPDQYTWFDATEGIVGRGFWARFASEVSVPSGTIPDQSQPVIIRLSPGWNLIGQPFVSPINWDHNAIKVQVIGGSKKSLFNSRDAVANLAWGWKQSNTNPNTGAYYLISDPRYIAGATQALQPWQAYWVKAYKTCDLTLPSPSL